MASGAAFVIPPETAVPGMATGAIGSSAAGVGGGGKYACGDIGIASGVPTIGAASGGMPYAPGIPGTP